MELQLARAFEKRRIFGRGAVWMYAVNWRTTGVYTESADSGVGEIHVGSLVDRLISQ